MATTSDVKITAGVGTNVATYDLTEDAETKKIQRASLNDSAGAEVIGLVGASPGANTVLDRLKSILTGTVLAAGANIIGKVGIDQTTPGTTNGVAITTLNGGVTNPTSTLALPNVSTAYTAGNLMASSATAGSVVVPSFTIPTASAPVAITRVRLSIADATTTAWPGQIITIDLWSAAPTFTNGDRGAFLVATGAASHIGSFVVAMSAAAGDGYYGEGAPSVGIPLPKISGSNIYWTATATSGSGVTGASKVVTLTAELSN